MELFTNQILAGIATGAIYACMALAVVMIYQAIDHLNFAQGEMAMFSTFIAWQVIQWGQPYWVAFVAAVVLSFIGGVAIERFGSQPAYQPELRTRFPARTQLARGCVCSRQHQLDFCFIASIGIELQPRDEFVVCVLAR